MVDNAELKRRQRQLREIYTDDPNQAVVIDSGRTGQAPGTDPFHTEVVPGEEYDVSIPVGVHRGVGGEHDSPNPGEILCSALAACFDSSIRMIAHSMRVELEEVSVHVDGRVDLRGTLGMSGDVPVGFQSFECSISLTPAPGTNPERVDRLIAAAERACVVRDTIVRPVAVAADFNVVTKQG